MDALDLMIASHQFVRASRVQGVSAATLAASLSAMSVHPLPSNGVLYREGDRADALYVLVEGTVVLRVGEAQHELARLKGPTIVGQLGLLAGLPRSSTVVAVGVVKVLRVGQKDVWDLVSGNTPSGLALRRLLLASLTQLVGQTGGRLEELAAEHGETIPKGDPRIQRSQQGTHRGRRSEADVEAFGDSFTDSLIAELDNVQVVMTEADDRRRGKT